MLVPQHLINIVFGPEQAHLVGAIAHHCGGSTRPQAAYTLLTHDGGSTVYRVLGENKAQAA